MKIKFSIESPTKSLRSLFGHCQLRVFLDNTSYIDIGRFSSSAIDRLRMYENLETTGCLAKIGDFCEFANSEILLGGEHSNSEVVNQVMSGCPVFQALLIQNGFNHKHKSKGRLSIGHGVIVSHGVKLLSGIDIGAGSIVAAGATVTKSFPEFSIIGGTPASLLSIRDVDKQSCYRFWDLNTTEIFTQITRKNMPNKEGAYNRDYKLVIKMTLEKSEEEGKFNGFQIMGVQTKDGFIQPHDKSEFMSYCKQVSFKKGEVAEWVSNPFMLRMH